MRVSQGTRAKARRNGLKLYQGRFLLDARRISSLKGWFSIGRGRLGRVGVLEVSKEVSKEGLDLALTALGW